ncbi:MAG: phage Gp37/Gp68 family protein [Lachnospiraceae bacterium]|jgi:protein gp37|nr:phage Gp37/Gp68 family protein [Lachnospiraceae bacterium]MCI1727269.1 phage Gp37/Gp68 family protein [Lachnospiraceae bacterium]
MPEWNPWHGCTKISPGCAHCYVYRRDAEFGKDSSVVAKTKTFDLPVRKDRHGSYKLQADEGIVYTCFTSDFFHKNADEWRKEAWEMIRTRSDLDFFMVTKRPERFRESLPSDWGSGYENVSVCCTCENQAMADRRLPVYMELPIRHKSIICEPMLEEIHIEKYLEQYPGVLENVICGGESGPEARLCDFAWVLTMMEECVKYEVPFHFKQTGANFKKGNRIYNIPRSEQARQAAAAHVDYKN